MSNKRDEIDTFHGQACTTPMTRRSSGNYRVVSIGEVLWDLLPEGAQMGGAPANVCIHARALGADAQLVSSIGRDSLGDKILQRFTDRGVPLDTIQRNDTAPTGTVDVTVDLAGQPQFTIRENAAWDQIVADDLAFAAVSSADAVCFGSLAQRAEISRKSIRALVAAAPPKALRVFDVNLRIPYISRSIIEESLILANVLKLNDAEIPVLAEMFGCAAENEERVVVQLATQFDLSVVACTRGSRGSLIWTHDQVSTHPGVTVKVRDTVGAGDAFTAALILGLLAGWPLDEINEHASQVAAFVCTRAGAIPPLPDSLRERFSCSLG